MKRLVAYGGATVFTAVCCWTAVYGLIHAWPGWGLAPMLIMFFLGAIGFMWFVVHDIARDKP